MQITSPRRRTRVDGDQTHTRILDAAGALFAARGYAETTGKAIAAEAEADLASINYHFGSRQGLYQAVLAEAHRRLIRLDRLQEIASSEVPASGKLSLLLDMLVGATDEEGWPAQVLARELMSPTSNAHVLLDAEIEPKLGLVQRVLSEATGIPAGDPALLRCMVSVAAPTLMLLVAGKSLPKPVGQALKASRDELLIHLHTFSWAGLQAVAQLYREHQTAVTRRPKKTSLT